MGDAQDYIVLSVFYLSREFVLELNNFDPRARGGEEAPGQADHSGGHHPCGCAAALLQQLLKLSAINEEQVSWNF